MNFFNKKLSLALLFLQSLLAPATASAQSNPLIGFMFADDTWLDTIDPIALYGFYQFQPDGSTGFTALSPTGPDNEWARCGGVYANKKFYTYNVSGSWIRYTLTYHIIDATTWTVEDTKAFQYSYSDSESAESQKARWIPSAMAYDAANDVVYAFTHRLSNSDNAYLSTVNRETGELSKVAEVPFVSAAACDAEGQLYAITIDGNLNKVSATGEFTIVGHTGYYPTRDSETNCGATVDFRSGKMFWTFYGFTTESDRDYNRNGITALMEVDTATGAAKVSWEYPTNQRLSALAAPNAHPMAPDNIGDLTFSQGASSAEGTISFTVPSLTFSQKPLDGSVEVECFVDGTSAGTSTAQPGTKFAKTVTSLTTGNHTASVVLRANGHESSAAYATAYFGYDDPSGVTDFTFTVDESANTATLTWTVPETGANGGKVNTDDLRYQIVRMPGATTVARSARGTSFTEDITFDWNLNYYRIQPYYNSDPSVKGSISTSNKIRCGKAMAIPYSESFDTPTAFNSFTTIDANGDGGEDWGMPDWKYDESYNCAFYYGKRDQPADDWLITPPLNLDADVLYKVTYDYYAYYGYGSHLKVAAGSEATVGGMSRELLDKEFTSTQSDKPGITETIYFAPRNGEKFIGFHHVSTTMEHLSIDNITVEAVGSSKVPEAVAGLTASEMAGHKAHLSFTVPTLNAAGNGLDGKVTVKIYKGTEPHIPAATLSDLAPGDKASWTDENSVADLNTYTVVTENSHGTGLSATVGINLALGEPVSVTNVKAVAVNGNQVEITWDPSTSATDAEGRPVDLTSMRYLVYKPVPTEDGLTDYRIIGRDLKECRFIDDNPADGIGDGQQPVAYYVAPVNGDDEGVAALSNYVAIGERYNLPFAEAWDGGIASTNPWLRSVSRGAVWYIRYQGYDPYTTDQKYVLTCEPDYGVEYGMGGIETPLMDLSSVANPTLKFKLYRSPDYVAGTNLMVYVKRGDKTELLPDGNISAVADNSGYETFAFSLAEYAHDNDVSFLFLGYASPNNTLHLDEVEVTGDALADKVKLTSFTSPAYIREKEPQTLSAVVSNIGSTNVSGVTVAFFVDGDKIGTASVEALAAGESATVQCLWTPGEEAIGNHTLKAAVNCTESTADFPTLEAYVVGSASNLPYLTAVKGSHTDEGVVIEWGMPDEADATETFIDKVDAYDSFAIEDVGAWTMIDNDLCHNYGLSDGAGGTIKWPNNDQLQAFIVFDTEYEPLPQLPFAATSGSKMFASWPAAGNANDDYLVSPELSGEAQLISFYARSFTDGASEPFNVYYSTGGTSLGDFVKINGDRLLNATAEWTLFHFAVPEGAKHFAINYVGNDGNGLFIDDLMYAAKPLGLVPDGYNIYRDGVKLNESPVCARRYVDGSVTAGSHAYTVAPVYNTVEARRSPECAIDLTGIADTAAQGSVTAVGGKEMIEVHGADGATVDIYAVKGQHLQHLSGTDNMQIACNPGFYVVTINGKSYKVAVH